MDKKNNKIIPGIKGIVKRKMISLLNFRHAQDFLYTYHNSSFKDDPEFIKAEAAGAATGTWSHIQWRVHTILWAASTCSKLDGDFIECGTYKGGFARAIIEYIKFEKFNKTFYLLDTFKGLEPELMSDEEKKATRKVYEDCYSEVVNTFKGYENVKLIKGIVPDTLGLIKSDKIAFISIDMNNAKPEIDAMRYLWPKLVVGGMVVLDDYAYIGYEPQYKAHNEWAESMGVKILTLPTGQGLLVKAL